MGINQSKELLVPILSHPTWDLILIFTMIAAGFFYGLSTGKGRVAATIIYTYVALAVLAAIPLERMRGFAKIDPSLLQLVLFIVTFFLLAFFLGSKRRHRGFAPARMWWRVFILSFLQVGLLIHIGFSFLPPEKTQTLAPLTRNFFANPNLHFWWIVLPLLILVILRRLEARED